MAKKKRRAPAQKRGGDVDSSPATHRPFAHLRDHPTRVAPGAAPKPAAPAKKAANAAPNERFADYMAGVVDAPRGARRATLDAADDVSFAQLHNDAALASAQQADRDARARAELAALVERDVRFDVVDDGTLLEGRRLDIEPRVMRRLRSKGIPVDGDLDLHGMRVEEAHDAVVRFLRKRSAEGDRVVRLIHGKGKGGPYGKGVLRGEIGAWLSQGPAARLVAAFASQVDGDGQSGSVLVVFASS